MSKEPLSDDVRRFLLTSVPSVPFLEALLLLRSEPGRAWDAAAIARRLYVPEARAAELLLALQQSGLASAYSGGGWRYDPLEPGLAAMVDTVERLYSTRLVEVASLIHSKVDKRAMQFADAFRWKKE